MRDEAGGPREFVSSGLSAEEVHLLTSFRPDGLRLFEYLRDQEAALRLEDFPGHIRSPGFSGELGHCRNFQDTPIRHRGAHMGNFFVRDKERAGASRMRTRNCWWSSPPGRRGRSRKRGKTASRASGPDAARPRLGRVHARDARTGRPAGHLHPGLRQRVDRRPRALGECRTDDELRRAAAPGLGPARGRRRAGGAQLREEAPSKDRRRTSITGLHPQRARRWLQNAEARRGVMRHSRRSAGLVGIRACLSSRSLLPTRARRHARGL